MIALLLTSLLACTDGQEALECATSALVTVYVDADNDGFGEPETAKQVCQVRRGYATNDDDCDDFRSDVNTEAIEACDGIDNDCDAVADEGLREVVFYLDADADGFGDPDTYKSTTACGPPPGYVANRLDCDDANAGIHPDGAEVCDGAIDNNCNGLVDDQDPQLDLTSAPSWYEDGDGDSYGDPDPDSVRVQCSQPGPGSVLNGDDCDDDDPNVHPGNFEYCNHYDDDCDHLIDDSDADLDPAEQLTWYADQDLDGAGDPKNTTLACWQPWFYVDNDTDCNDQETLVQSPELWVEDTDGDGYGAGTPSEPRCDAPYANWELELKGIDCDDTNPFTSPIGTEICDGDDNDCDGDIDDADPDLDPAFALTFYRDVDRDTYGDPSATAQACTPPPFHVADDTDCNDADAAVNPGATEVCDGADNDCDSDIDDDDADVDLGSAGTWWPDFDTDGFGDPNLPIDACTQPTNHVDNGLDCDDTDPDLLANGPWLDDFDGDGVGAGPASPASCSAPAPGWVPDYWGVDCAPGDPTRFPGNVEICSNGNDEDCDSIDPPCAPPEPSYILEQAERNALVIRGVRSVIDAYDAWLGAWSRAVPDDGGASEQELPGVHGR